MPTGSVDVVVVDDAPEAARDYSELIAAKTGLSVRHTSDVVEAIDVCQSQGVKVLVVDQRMPDQAGTDLYRKVKEVNPYIRAVLLTGEASRDEVGLALKLGFRQYLSKSNIQELAEIVRHEYVAYETESAALTTALPDNPMFVRRSGLLRRRPNVTYTLVRAQLISDAHIFPDSWRNIVTLHAGQTERIKVSTSFKDSLVLEEETALKLAGEAGLSPKQLGSLKFKLNSEIAARLKEVRTLEVSRNEEVERTFQLPQEPSDTNAVHVRFRRIQHAPVYSRVRVDVASKCSCCPSTGMITFEVFLATGRTAVQHEDRLSDGEVRTYELGTDPP
ncbi:response regulator [Actinomadura sp. BRA 177]|uniref:response regulator n=1 Tax=Actinomadura sp. BRA 177 TaxID=2745202 RepID=UPI0020CF63F4|nr:response regulator [Actinomadura sp. BRA 177]